MKKLIILDRDGVINQDSNEYIKSEEEWEAIPGSLDAIARLNRDGYRIVVASNQSGLARGKLDILALHAIHRKMLTHLSQYGGVIEAIFFCPHEPEDDCQCRKPQPGLLHEISRRLRVPLYKATFIGDSLSDMEAAQAVKAKPVLVRTGNDQSELNSKKIPADVTIYDNLAGVADALISAG